MIIELLVEIVGEMIGHFLPDLSPQTKFEKHLTRLRKEAWFSSLEKDFRYEYIIHHNKQVKRFLSSEKHIKMITSMEEERENFIRLVKKEHERYTALR